MSKSTSESRIVLPLLALSCLALLGSIGCRSARDNQIDLLERELRVQEDYIYELEDYVVEYSEKLRACRSCPQQTAVYAEEVYDAEPAPSRSSNSNKSTSNKSTRSEKTKERSVVPKQDELPAPQESDSPEEFDPSQLEVPDELDLDIGEPVSDADQPSDDVYQFAEDGSLILPDPTKYQSDVPVDEILGPGPDDDEQFVEELFADDQIETSGALVERVADRVEVTQLFRGEGDQQAPKSLLTVVEALDNNDEPVDMDGEVSLMVMTTDGEQPQRVKRWNFTAEETIAAWQSSDLGDGLHLELPLEEMQLPAEPLELWVRLVTRDGRKLLTQLPFEREQLLDVANAAPEPRAQGLQLAEVETESEPQTANPLRPGMKTSPIQSKLQLAKSEESDNQPRWRASMERTDRTSEGFATTSNNSQGWKRQTPGRQPYVSPRMATRPLPMPSSAPSKASPLRPTWSAGRR